MRTICLIASGVIFAVIVAFHRSLEADAVLHVLVLLPALAIFGGLLAIGLGLQCVVVEQRTANAISLVAVFTILFWMLPRSIDHSLVDPWMMAAKYVSIPLLVGAPFAFAWRSSHPFLRGFLKANALSMLGVLAYLYTHAPIRICNSYLVVDQQRLGYGFLFVAVGLAVAWSVPLFLSPTKPPQSKYSTLWKAMK